MPACLNICGFCPQPDVQAEMKTKVRVTYYRREQKNNVNVLFQIQCIY